MNKTFANSGRQILKGLLSKCTEAQQILFKRMYANQKLDASIDEAVDQMEESKIDWAISQVERTIEKNAKKFTTFLAILLLTGLSCTKEHTHPLPTDKKVSIWQVEEVRLDGASSFSETVKITE